MKNCPKCKQQKDESHFYNINRPKSKGASILSSWCKSCSRESTKKWIEQNLDKNKEIKRRYQWKAQLNFRYRITEEEFNRVSELQNGICPLCLEKPKLLTVDHDHCDGMIRGLICGRCNSALGLAKDKVETFERMIRYLKDGGHTIRPNQTGKWNKTRQKDLSKP